MRDEFHDEIRAVFEKHGVVDMAYCGVTMEGDDTSGFCVGTLEGRGNSNRHRIQRMTGVLEQMRLELNADFIEQWRNHGRGDDTEATAAGCD